MREKTSPRGRKRRCRRGRGVKKRLGGVLSPGSEEDAAASGLQVMLRTERRLLSDWSPRDSVAFKISLASGTRFQTFPQNKRSRRTASDCM